jgi:hypothetical protein
MCRGLAWPVVSVFRETGPIFFPSGTGTITLLTKQTSTKGQRQAGVGGLSCAADQGA